MYQAHNPLQDISKLEIDHKDINRLNNNIENLRACSHAENSRNMKIRKNNTSGYKNIRKTKFNTYIVSIRKTGKEYSKTLKTLEEAIEWRNIKLVELHGEFSNLG